MQEQPDFYGTQEAARILGVSVRTVQLWVEKGLLKAWKTAGGHRRISRDSVSGLLRTRQGKNQVDRQDADDKLCILVIEDDPTVQAYYSALINILEPDATLKIASDGYEGLITLGEIHPQLLLLDVDMPQMDGIQLLNKLRNLSLPSMPAVAVVTGLNQQQLEQRGGVPAGIPVYHKPLNIDDFGKLLEQLHSTESEKPS
ncbi:MAG: response regulator [Gammaproteobacteria bacterium]|nr:response regulator [Gammaproteobacteria bacterium]